MGAVPSLPTRADPPGDEHPARSRPRAGHGPPGPAPTTGRSRVTPCFDNAKLLLVTLVVVGHSWTLLPDVSTSSPVYTFLYPWHVPAFVMVTGYLSRSFTFTRETSCRLVTTVVVPYFVFETLLALFRSASAGRSSTALPRSALADVVPLRPLPAGGWPPRCSRSCRNRCWSRWRSA